MAAAKKDLVIVESPAKARTIEKYLGPNYHVVASMGHLRDLPKSTMGVDIDHGFTPDYQPVKAREDVIEELQKLSKNAGTVYLATDPDREGEAISWHLKELLGLPDDRARRVTFNEITKKVVTESIAAPREIDQDLVDAQQARRSLDTSSATSSRRCCGARSAGAFPPGACSRSRPAWSSTAKTRSRSSSPRSTGIST